MGITANSRLSQTVPAERIPGWFGRPKTLGMWLFVLSDSCAFAAIFIVYAYLRIQSRNWPTPFRFDPAIVSAIFMTACLFNNTMAMTISVRQTRQGKTRSTRRWLASAFVGASAFALLQIVEGIRLMSEGLTPSSLPASWLERWPGSSPLFGACLYAIDGFHLLHVFAGLGYLGVVFVRLRKLRKLKVEDIEAAALYWRFVFGAWLVIFALCYLTSIYRA